MNYIYRIYFIIWLSGLLFGQSDYSLQDLNSNSEYFGQSVGTSFFNEDVVVHYFGHFY
ncbi:hypothetical protein OAP42_03700 [Candidatus Marinimicrobia bacterium]|jgi:hypothetical protein|nr:hypothetical protein [Candidatus Neomarinimicrobiota bacterium]MDA8753901.1 hypothetical protein [Candidatus Neomarinimicrobiota bacterium]MDC0631181.1 hypothetical protein [Candidatus Neomarinimicrobiota bacterium]